MQLSAHLSPYLASSSYIDFTHPLIAAKALQLACENPSELALIKASFEFVRDEIQHSWDFRKNPVTCSASAVLIERTGFCFAKSHLLAALLRANNIPTALCYQRLSVSGKGAPYCLHGLNAVYLTDLGWYRLDARGNKPGVTAQFTPPLEQLAFTLTHEQERNLPERWADPMPLVVAALEKHTTITALFANLPDIE
jgi:transglutaminase-like putative cysteine protease